MKVRQLDKKDSDTTVFTIVDNHRSSLVGVQVLVIANNNTYFEGITDVSGQVIFSGLPVREYSIFFAHTDYPGFVVDGYIPTKDLEVALHQSQNVGSVIISSGTGYIPVLDGRLNPIRDTSDRTYLYAENIAIEGGKNQPVKFIEGEQVKLEDRSGTEVSVIVVRIQGRSSLLQYQLHSLKQVSANGEIVTDGLGIYTPAVLLDADQTVDITAQNKSLGWLERITNNQTFSIVGGGLFLLCLVYLIFVKTGVNLNNLTSEIIQATPHTVTDRESSSVIVKGTNYSEEGFSLSIPIGNTSTCVWTWVAGTGSIPESKITNSTSNETNLHKFSADLFNGRDFKVGCTNDYGEYYDGKFVDQSSQL